MNKKCMEGGEHGVPRGYRKEITFSHGPCWLGNSAKGEQSLSVVDV